MINKKFAKDMLFSLYNLNGWKSYFIKIRFWDAPFTLVEQLVPKSGTIIELGCGEGCFTNYMGLSSSKRNILGIELSDRVLDADKGLPNVRYKKGNALSAQFPKCNAIVAFHLLHHLLSFLE
jgi:tRNA G46 methylase TrmB